jgi:hypothetical protein
MAKMPVQGATRSKLANMNHSQTQNESRLEQFGKHVLAGLLILIVALIALKIVIGIVAALFFPILAIIAIVAVIWAMRVLF